MFTPDKKLNINLLKMYLLLVAIPFIILTGCGGNEAGFNQKIKLRLAWWGTQRLHASTLQAVALYEKRHPNVSITCEYTSRREYWSKLESAVSNKDLPDIIQQDYSLLNNWVTRGLLLPLDKFVESHLIDLRNVPQTTIDAGKINAKIYGINLGNNVLAWLIDEEVFAKAGVPIPANNWTWDDLEKIAMTLAPKGGMEGFPARLFNHQICRSYLLGYKEWWCQTNEKLLNYSDEHFINYLKMLIRLQGINQLQGKNTNMIPVDDEKDADSPPILAPTTAISYMWTNHLLAVHDYWEKHERILKLHTAPRPKDGQPADYIKPVMFFSLTRDTKYAAEAAKFINWFINSLEAGKLLMAERGVPVSRKIQKGLKPLLSAFQGQVFDFVNNVTINGIPIPPADNDINIAVRDNIYYLEVVDPLMDKIRTPEEAASIFRMMAGEVLARN